MSSEEENNRIENASRSAYDGRMDVRFIAIETRIAALEVDVAVIRTSFATKDDVQRIMAILHEHKLEFTKGFADQRADLADQRAEFHSALSKNREDFNIALSEQSAKLTAALAQQNEKFTVALAQQNHNLTTSLAQQSERFDSALATHRDDLNKTLMSHIWKFYGFAVVLMSGVYYIARYVR